MQSLKQIAHIPAFLLIEHLTSSKNIRFQSLKIIKRVTSGLSQASQSLELKCFKYLDKFLQHQSLKKRKEVLSTL